MQSGASSMHPPTASTGWWDNKLFAALLIVAVATPLLVPRTPPLVDLLGHMGRYRVELDLATSPTLRRFYDFQWSIMGNLGVDLLILPLGRVLGLEPGIKLIAIAIPVIGAAGLLWTAREVHGRLPPTTAAALPFLFGFPFDYGFLNYCLAMSLALCAFALWLRLADKPASLAHGLLFGAIALLLWLCHAFGWAVFLVLVVGSELAGVHSWGEARAKVIRLIPLVLPLVAMFLWRGAAPPLPPMGWFNVAQKIYWLESGLRDRWATPDYLMMAGAVLLLIAALASSRLTFERRLAVPALLLAGCFLILPESLFGSSYADARLIPYVFSIGFISIRPARAPIVAGAALFLLIAKLGLFAVANILAGREIDAALVALDRVEPGARIASIVVVPCGDWALPKLSHVGGMTIVRRGGFSNEQWVGLGTNPLRTTTNYSGAMTHSWSEAARLPSCPSNLPLVSEKLAAVPRATFDYVWLVDAGRPNIPDASLIGIFGRTSLYRFRVRPSRVG